MKPFLISALMLLVCTVPLFSVTGPYHKARASLENAHNLIEKRKAGAKKAGLDEILSVVIKAETHLTDGKNNRGSTIPVALKAVASAKEELQTAKSEKDKQEAHIEKADDFIQEALKHVNEALHQHPGKS